MYSSYAQFYPQDQYLQGQYPQGQYPQPLYPFYAPQYASSQYSSSQTLNSSSGSLNSSAGSLSGEKIKESENVRNYLAVCVYDSLNRKLTNKEIQTNDLIVHASSLRKLQNNNWIYEMAKFEEFTMRPPTVYEVEEIKEQYCRLVGDICNCRFVIDNDYVAEIQQLMPKDNDIIKYIAILSREVVKSFEIFMGDVYFTTTKLGRQTDNHIQIKLDRLRSDVDLDKRVTQESFDGSVSEYNNIPNVDQKYSEVYHRGCSFVHNGRSNKLMLDDAPQ